MIPAQNLDAEEIAIGLIQMRGAAAVEACLNHGLEERHFLDPVARKAFSTAVTMSHEGAEINFLCFAAVTNSIAHWRLLYYNSDYRSLIIRN